MAESDLSKLAQAQQETVQALAVLTQTLSTAGTSDAVTGNQSGAALEQTLESTAKAVSDLGQATSANTQALSGLSRGLADLPGLLAGLVGGIKDGSGGLSGVLKGGLGLGSLALGIAGLFRSKPADPAPLTRFALPSSLSLEVANTDDILAGFPRADRGQSGEVRTTESQPAPVVVQPQVTVNVSAMDSRSFLDRSDDIAKAVREAMLYMHPVNDLINEL